MGSLDSRAVLDRRTKSPDTKAHAGGAGGARVNWSTLGKNITREKICISKVNIETTSDLIEQLLIAIHLNDSTYFYERAFGQGQLLKTLTCYVNWTKV